MPGECSAMYIEEYWHDKTSMHFYSIINLKNLRLILSWLKFDYMILLIWLIDIYNATHIIIVERTMTQ